KSVVAIVPAQWNPAARWFVPPRFPAPRVWLLSSARELTSESVSSEAHRFFTSNLPVVTPKPCLINKSDNSAPQTRWVSRKKEGQQVRRKNGAARGARHRR